MDHISLKENFLLGRDETMNSKLQLKKRIINRMLLTLDGEGIDAEVLLIADTTNDTGTIYSKITCEDGRFKDLLELCLSQLTRDF